MKVVVIGAGFGGLAVGIRLQAQGHDVTIVEKLTKPGGRANVFEQDGFTFDAGPTIITAPWMLEELFAIGGLNLADHVDLVRLDPCYEIRFENGNVFRYQGDDLALEDEVRRFEPADVAGYRRFALVADEAFRRAMPLIDRPFDTPASMLRVVPDLVRVRAHRSVAAIAEGCFSNRQLQQVFSFHPLLIGGNPFTTPALYTLIHALEKRWGVWFAMGGMGAVVTGLTQLFNERGGTLLMEREVASITLDASGRRATGVRLTNGVAISADAVACNADVAHAYERLVPRRRSYSSVRRKRHSMSLFVLYFGTDRRYDHMAHHTILMGPRYQGLLEDVFSRGRLADDFSLYLHRPTATDPALAPNGCDTWYALAPVPNLSADIDWTREAPRYRDRIVRYLEDRYLPELSKHIVTERCIDPRYFRDTLNSYLGAAFSLQPLLTQSAWFRPHNASEDVANLYFVGAGTHPGAGVPGVLSSAKIVADLIGRAKPDKRAAFQNQRNFTARPTKGIPSPWPSSSDPT